MLQYSIYQILSAYQENKHIVDAYLKGHPVEGYNCDCTRTPVSYDCQAECSTILGMTVGVFAIIAIMALFMYGLAIYIVWKNRNIMPNWAVILCLLLLLFVPGSPIFVIILGSVIKK